jgi:excisionase family DNA binding protein
VSATDVAPLVDPRATQGGTRRDPKSNYDFPGMASDYRWRQTLAHRHTAWSGCARCGQRFKGPHAAYTHLAKAHHVRPRYVEALGRRSHALAGQIRPRPGAGGRRGVSPATVRELPARPAATLPPDRYLTRDELAEHLGVVTKTVDRMRREGCPSYTFARRLRRFRLAEVESWLRDREKRTMRGTENGPAPPQRPGPGTTNGGRDARAA